jgi:hypothetical protein
MTTIIDLINAAEADDIPHTKGPWTYRDGGIWGRDGFLVAAVTVEDNQHIQRDGFADANGRLIACAPAFYAAVQLAVKEL